MRHKDSFGFSRLLLLLGGGLGVWAIFRPFYSLPQYDARVSAFDLMRQWLAFFQGTNEANLVFGLLINRDWFSQLLFSISLLLPLLFSVVALELALRSVVLRWRVSHRVWIFVLLSLVGVAAGWAGSFHFFAHVQSGYWTFWAMIMFSLAAKFSDE